MPLILTLLFFFLTVAVPPSVADDVLTCTTARGQNKEIRYPFGFEGDRIPEEFKLKCNRFSQVLLHVPNAGNFIVKQINYNTNSIIINGCVSPSSFSNIHPFFTDLTEVTYFHCRSNVSAASQFIKSMECLKVKNNTVVAIANSMVERYKSKVSSCKKQPSTYEVPTSWLYSSNDDAVLFWETQTTTKKGLSTWKRIVSLVLLILYGVFCLSCCWCFMKDRRGWGNMAGEVGRRCSGLDANKMEAYPSMELGESMRLPNSHEITCPVCLCDFKPKDTVKTIHCGHIFHVDCIDQWLQRSATCPVCRKMPSD